MPEENKPPDVPPSKDLLKTRRMAPEVAGAGGWTPGKNTPIFAAVFVGITTAVVPVLMLPEPRWNVLLASALGGAASSLATYLGMRSAGPRQP